MHSMHSNKIPITMRADTSRSQFNASKPAALCATGDPEDFGTVDVRMTCYDYSSGGVNRETFEKRASGHVTDIVSAETYGREAHAPRLSKTPGTLPGRPA